MESTYDHRQCEANVIAEIRTNPCVQLMLLALEASGCPVKLRRHISCEPCAGTLKGGFDSKNNQVLICENRRLSSAEVGRTLTHELVHAYDHCTREVDWEDARHLACAEIRAANLTDCSPLRAVFRHFPPTIRALKGGHRSCVEDKAVGSVAAVLRRQNPTKDSTGEVGDHVRDVVTSVFEVCYEDVRPFPRRRPPYDRNDCRDALKMFTSKTTD